MNTGPGPAPLLRRTAAEAIGTFMLVAVGPGAVMVAASTGALGTADIALAFGVIVTVVVAALGPVSGAHINPAVTISLWSVGRFAGREVLPYLTAQCVGAVAASVVSGWILGPVGAYGATVPAISVWAAFLAELGYSGFLGFVIASVTTSDRVPKATIPVAIGGTVFAGALVLGPFTGGSFNPARSLGPAVAAGVWTAHWLYWVAPVAGMVIAMRLARHLAIPEVVRDFTWRTSTKSGAVRSGTSERNRA